MLRFSPQHMILSAALLMTSMSGCSKQEQISPANDTRAPRVEKFSSGPVTVTLTFTPPTVRLDRETLLSINISTPTNITATLPAIESRLQGFSVAGAYDRQPETRKDRLTIERHVRLTPKIAPRYRISPMAITWTRFGDSREQWFPTRSVVLESEPLVKDTPSTLAGPQSPYWIYPDPLTILTYLGIAIGTLSLLYFAWRLFRRFRRAIILKRMSPRERALFELAELLDRGLIAKDRVKDFYFELTMIVRCYIERAHAIRAPEQTTEEFLIAVSKDPRFSREVVMQLRSFLNAADLVKYAAYRPERQSVDEAITTAKTYIVTDSDTNPSLPEPRTLKPPSPPANHPPSTIPSPPHEPR